MGKEQLPTRHQYGRLGRVRRSHTAKGYLTSAVTNELDIRRPGFSFSHLSTRVARREKSYNVHTYFIDIVGLIRSFVHRRHFVNPTHRPPSCAVVLM